PGERLGLPAREPVPREPERLRRGLPAEAPLVLLLQADPAAAAVGPAAAVRLEGATLAGRDPVARLVRPRRAVLHDLVREAHQLSDLLLPAARARGRDDPGLDAHRGAAGPSQRLPRRLLGGRR